MYVTPENSPNTARIGEGIFLIKDISIILDISPSKVRHWLIEFWNNKFGSKIGGYSFGDNNNRAINFYTLIEFMVFSKLREKGFSAQKLQKIHAELSKTLQTPYPFVKTNVSADSKSIYYEQYDELIKIDGKNQFSLKKILSPFLDKIEIDKNGIARYYPLGKKRKIVIDPNHQFGQPTVLGTNIKAETIYSLYKGKETKKNICELYDISIEQVNDAILYFEKNLQKMAA